MVSHNTCGASFLGYDVVFSCFRALQHRLCASFHSASLAVALTITIRSLRSHHQPPNPYFYIYISHLHSSNGAAVQIGVADDGTALGLCGEDLDASLNTLAEMAEAVGAHITLLRRRPSLDEQGMLAEVHVRRVPDDRQFLDVRAVVLGASGAGKSTLISVLASGQLDSGAGSARLNLFRHNHEIVTGRTSALSTEVLGFDADGRLLNNADADDAQAVAGGEAAAAEEVYTRASKLVHLADSPGHAKVRCSSCLGPQRNEEKGKGKGVV